MTESSRELDATPSRLTIREGVAVLTMDSPPVNALSESLIEGVGEHVDRAAGEAVGVLIIRSASPTFFGAGGDLRFFEGATADEFGNYLHNVRRLMDQIESFPCPTVACIDGAALGGGLELALACDIRFLGHKATLALPEVSLGLLPGAGGTQRLTKAVGRQRALDLMLSGRRIDAATAAEWGLGRLCTDPGAEAHSWAEIVASQPRPAVEAIRQCVAVAGTSFGPDLELASIRELFSSTHTRDLISAFMSARRSTDPR
ncbi:enoyl-CoA hydratase/isomerase family protein [Nocardioides pyridinolyticus]